MHGTPSACRSRDRARTVASWTDGTGPARLPSSGNMGRKQQSILRSGLARLHWKATRTALPAGVRSLPASSICERRRASRQTIEELQMPHFELDLDQDGSEIGRATVGERVCQIV